MIFICVLCVLVKEKLVYDFDSEIVIICFRVLFICFVSYN